MNNNKFRILISTLMLLLLTSLTGCSEAYPEQAQDGTPWNREWTILGSTLGVEEPGYGLTLLENPVVLTGNDTHYATWVVGEPTSYVNAEGKDTDLYEAELYLLLYGCADHENALVCRDEWMARETATYTLTDTREVTCNDVDYTCLIYEVASNTNPYERGVSAFAVYDNYSVCAELTCVEGYEEDLTTMLTDFLNGCHYAK